MRKWTNPDDKKAAYLAVLKKIMIDKRFAEKCLESDEFARNAFRTVGEIEVPENAKVVFLPEGDLDNAKRDGTGSVVIEMPPRGKGDRNSHAMEYVRCSYTWW
jgi:hypothetical protein